MIEQVEEVEGRTSFTKDYWEKFSDETNSTLTGYGLTSVMQKGDLIEKGAISTTITSGILSLERAKAISSRRESTAGICPGNKYFTCALSLVLHSSNPMCPTYRADVRYFELEVSSLFCMNTINDIDFNNSSLYFFRMEVAGLVVGKISLPIIFSRRTVLNFIKIVEMFVKNMDMDFMRK